MVLRKSFYIRWSAGRSPRVHEVNPGRDPSTNKFRNLHSKLKYLRSRNMVLKGTRNTKSKGT